MIIKDLALRFIDSLAGCDGPIGDIWKAITHHPIFAMLREMLKMSPMIMIIETERISKENLIVGVVWHFFPSYITKRNYVDRSNEHIEDMTIRQVYNCL